MLNYAKKCQLAMSKHAILGGQKNKIKKYLSGTGGFLGFVFSPPPFALVPHLRTL